MAYSQDLRQRVLAFYDQGVPTIEVARRLSVSASWCRRVKQRRDQPRRVVGGSRPRLDEAARAALGRWIDQKPDATLEELRWRIRTQLGLVVSIGCLWNTLRRMKLSYKKSR
jgi:transposase